MAFYCNGKKDMCDCDILCADCDFYDNTGGKKFQTNADRIRAMRDEELAIFLCGKIECCAIYCPGAELCHSNGGRANGLVKWLQQPAGEE